MNVSVHEAGHAVVARWAGLRPKRVSIDAIGGGECEYDEPARRRLDPVGYMRELLTVAVAGVAAEQLANGINPLNAAAPPDVVAQRILTLERATNAPVRIDGGSLRHPDCRRWAIDELAAWLRNETMAYELVDEVLGPDALRRAAGVLIDRWDEVEAIAKRLESEGEIQL